MSKLTERALPCVSNGLFDFRIILWAPVFGRARRLRGIVYGPAPSPVCLRPFIMASSWLVLLPLVALPISHESPSCYFTAATSVLESSSSPTRSGVSPPVRTPKPPKVGAKPPCTMNDRFFYPWPNLGPTSPAFTLLFNATLLFLSSILFCRADFWSSSSSCIALIAISAFYF